MRRLRVACTAACASGVITPTTGTASCDWRSGNAAEVAALQATTISLTPCPSSQRADLEREPADLGQRTRAVRESRRVAEVDEVLVRQRHEQLVQDGQPAHARVEYADRPSRPSRRDSMASALTPYGPASPLVAICALGLCWRWRKPHFGRLAAWTKTDQMRAASDGTQLATSLYVPVGAPPAGGYPAIVMFHGIGGRARR